MNSIVITTVAVAAAGGLLYFFYKKGSQGRYFCINNENSETVDGELKMSDVVNYLKLRRLSQDKHTPFMAKLSNSKIRGMVKGDLKQGYEAIFIGVYNNKTNEIEIMHVFFAKSLDQQIIELMGDETLIVLS